MAYTVHRLDDELNPIGELQRVVSASIAADGNDEVPLIMSASVEVRSEEPNWEPGWFRIDRLDGRRSMLGVFRLELSSIKLERGMWTAKLTGCSVLKPADEAEVEAGAYIAAGSDGAAFAADMLSACPGRVSVTGSCPVASSIVFDSGCSRLKAAWTVLDSIGWCIKLAGDGGITICPMPDSVSATLDRGSILPGISAGNGKVSYQRAYIEGLSVFDMVRVSVPENGIDGLHRISSQSLSLTASLKVDETAGGLSRRG